MQQLEKDVGEILESIAGKYHLRIYSNLLVVRQDDNGSSEVVRTLVFSGACELREKVTELRDFLRERKKPKEPQFRVGDIVQRMEDGPRGLMEGTLAVVTRLEGGSVRINKGDTHIGIAKTKWRNLTVEAEKAAE